MRLRSEVWALGVAFGPHTPGAADGGERSGVSFRHERMKGLFLYTPEAFGGEGV